MKRAIIAPIGGFGNHIRWILLLDQQFIFNFSIPESTIEKNYNNLKGINWPSFTNFTQDYAQGKIANHIILEIQSRINLKDLIKASSYKTDSLIGLSDPKSKVEYIEKYVYCQERTWQNWLAYEGLLLETYDMIFLNWTTQTQYDDAVWTSYDKILVGTVNPHLSLKCYIKFNSHLNKLSMEVYTQHIDDGNKKMLEYASNNYTNNIFLLDNTILFQETLDKTFYETIINWFELENNYEYASRIHKVWYLLHKKSEEEMIETLQTLFNEG